MATSTGRLFQSSTVFRKYKYFRQFYACAYDRDQTATLHKKSKSQQGIVLFHKIMSQCTKDINSHRNMTPKTLVGSDTSENLAPKFSSLDSFPACYRDNTKQIWKKKKCQTKSVKRKWLWSKVPSRNTVLRLKYTFWCVNAENRNFFLLKSKCKNLPFL